MAEYLAVRALLPAQWQDILDLAYYSGWRKHEILGLTWDEIDEAGGVIRLSPARSKTLVGRILPISHPIAEALARRRARRDPDSPLVFHRDGIPVRRWRTAWRTACQAAGVPTRFLHDCRRTAARNLIRASVPERVAMLLTGHKTRAIFDRYNIINEQELLEAGDPLVASLAQHAPATPRGRRPHPAGTAGPRTTPPLRHGWRQWPEPVALACDGARRRATRRSPSAARGAPDGQRRPDVRCHATWPQSWIQRENWEFETHRWRRTFEAQVIEHAEARDLHSELVEDEGRLSRFRRDMPLGYVDATKGPVRASSVELSVMLTTDPDEGRRRAAWEGLRTIEPFVLSHGFLDLVRKRNRLGRLLGGVDFYDATVRRTEGLTKAEIFAWLDELEVKTRARTRASLRELAALKGDDALRPWNLRFAVSGAVTTEKDPHFPFGASLARWGRSFGALGIGYRGAQLVLDLVDRKGKYENGFMHGPVPAWRERGTWRPARIQFTANAIPGMVGSGQRATETLFHEGGHAAHFANVDMPAPCFAQEFAPSSVAMAETQSMFLDSLLSDADWQTRYARTVDGETMPFALIEKAIRQGQPHAAFAVRSMLAVCYAEKAIYEIPDDALTAERVLQEVRDIERRLLFLDEGSPRPVLSVPHLLSSDSSAYYHGYVLAEMAVAQTRAFFEHRDGHLTDNRRIGADLRDSYWREGNLRRFDEFVERLTRRPLSADDMAQRVNREPDEAVDDARARIDTLADVPPFTATVALGATIRVVDGHDVVASLADGDSFEEMADTFRTWVERRAAARLETSPD